jgi:hypothetical protein
MYGYPPAQILEWVEQCVARLQQFTPDVVITGLPHAAVAGLPAARYLLFRSIFFPRCRLTLDDTMRIGAEVDAGLQAIAASRGASFLRRQEGRARPDPHRPGMWNGLAKSLARELAGGRATRKPSPVPAARAGILPRPQRRARPSAAGLRRRPGLAH